MCKWEVRGGLRRATEEQWHTVTGKIPVEQTEAPFGAGVERWLFEKKLRCHVKVCEFEVICHALNCKNRKYNTRDAGELLVAVADNAPDTGRGFGWI